MSARDRYAAFFELLAKAAKRWKPYLAAGQIRLGRRICRAAGFTIEGDTE